MPSLCVCWHHFQLMRYCCRGMWTCLLILEACHSKWRWLFLVWNTWILSYLYSHRGEYLQLLALDYALGFSLSRRIRKKYWIIWVVCIWYCLCWKLSAPCFVSVQTFSFVRSVDVRSMYSRQITNKYGANISSCKNSTKISIKLASPSGEQTITFVFLLSIIVAVTVYRRESTAVRIPSLH